MNREGYVIRHPDILGKVDRIAKRKGKTRDQIVNELLLKELENE